MAKKYYAVKKGKSTGIFLTWDECKKQTVGFKGAIYKSFLTLEEAENYIQNEAKITPLEEFSGAICYVDGSFNVHTNEFSYGAVILYENQEHHFNKKFTDPELASMRNVAGEIKGSECAMTFCLENSISACKIYYDYEGVSRWCLGEWKTNKDGTRAYKAFYDSIKENLSVEFIKVKAHSGDKYNDLADRLAKDALGIQ